MFYHNHRRYKKGQRAGKTPYELLTGEQQDKDWMEFLFEIIDDNSSIHADLLQQYPAQVETDEILRCHRVSDDYASCMVASH
ncbi:MAG: hypothetical protein HQK61_04095 [Desulfamplus sp.]|nr:hypothetical protein [Desulfamplus sp.]